MNLSNIKINLIVFIITLTACGNNEVKNSALSKFSPTSKEYKDELAEKIKSNPEGLTYTFNKYLQKNGHEYLDVQVNGNNFKATGLILVNNWHKLEEIKKTKGLGYSGAELKGLQLDIQPNALGAELVYKDMENIVD